MIQSKNKNRGVDFNLSETWYLITDFDYTNAKYLIPFRNTEENHTVPLYEGQILEEKNLCTKEETLNKKSGIWITGFENLFDYLAEPYVFPVRTDKRTRPRKLGGNLWSVSRVKLLKPMNVWEFFSKAPLIFPGSMNLKGQPYLPDGLRFPSVIKGNLLLYHHLLPSAARLPERVEGTMEIQYCRIPPAWKFPKKIKRLIIDSCSFIEVPDFSKSDIAELHIRNTGYPGTFRLPEIFPGKISIGVDTITSDFNFPQEVGSLSISEARLEEGVKLPEKVTGELSIVGVGIAEGVIMPDNCKKLSLVDLQLPLVLKIPGTGIENIEIISCLLSEQFTIDGIPGKRLTFKMMKIPSGMKIPEEFAVSLEFEECEIDDRFRLPDKITLALKLLHCKISGKMKLPVSGDYNLVADNKDS